MDGKSLAPKKIKLKQLQELMPEVFSEGKVDFERLKASLDVEVCLLGMGCHKLL